MAGPLHCLAIRRLLEGQPSLTFALGDYAPAMKARYIFYLGAVAICCFLIGDMNGYRRGHKWGLEDGAHLPGVYHPINSCAANLRQIDGVKQQWTLEHHKSTNDIPTWSDLFPYLREADGYVLVPFCPRGGIYSLGRADERPKCSIGGPDHACPE